MQRVDYSESSASAIALTVQDVVTLLLPAVDRCGSTGSDRFIAHSHVIGAAVLFISEFWAAFEGLWGVQDVCARLLGKLADRALSGPLDASGTTLKWTPLQSKKMPCTQRSVIHLTFQF